MAIEALAKIKDVEVLRPYSELVRSVADATGRASCLIAAGLIADKLAALEGIEQPVGQEESEDHE